MIGYWYLIAGGNFRLYRGLLVNVECVLQVYCKCRGPHQAKQLDESYNWMVQCGTCKEWYHRRCITLLATDIDPFTGKVADDYLCKRCKDQGKGLV